MAIDRQEIISNLSKIDIKGNEDGLIHGYGVMISQLPADFWNSFSKKILDAVSNDLKEAAWGLLYNAANECGYHTGNGIITSEEWQATVAPMVEKAPEDVLHGAFAVFTAWGWGNVEIVELTPNERLVVRAYNYYEMDLNPDKSSPIVLAPMITGVSAAFMDLAYGDAYPNGLRTFIGKQVKGIECGDDYGEFIITKNNDDEEHTYLS